MNDGGPSWSEKQKQKNRQGLIILAAVVLGLAVVFGGLYIFHGGQTAGVHQSRGVGKLPGSL